MVTTRRSAAEKSGVALGAAAAQRQRSTTGGRARSRTAGSRGAGLPAVYEEMLAEAGVVPLQPAIEPPRKRLKRPGEKAGRTEKDSGGGGDNRDNGDDHDDENDEEDEDVEFEDIVIPAPVIQTTEMDSEDSDDSDDSDGDEARVQAAAMQTTTTTTTTTTDALDAPQSLELNLTAHETALAQLLPRRTKTAAGRRKPLSRAERIGRLDVHKMHMLCLLAHVSRRNRWCNRAAVQAALRPLLSAKTVTYLNPASHLSQFGRTESLKNGLQQAAAVFRARFVVTERGMRRALWAEDVSQLRDVDFQPPADSDAVLDEDDFVQAARSLRGSRDVGAQLFCALLRAVGVETRLVCSLQPLSFLADSPTMSRQHKKPSRAAIPIPEIYQSPPSPQQQQQQQDPFVSPLRRLGHPQAAAYNIPSMPPPRTPPRTTTTPAVPIGHVESAFPVYWVEVLDVAHQKWQPVDPLVTATQWKPARLEPPASDRNNQLTYVIGFSADRSAKDVTRRYAKAYNAKTRRARVDGPASTVSLSSSPSPALSGPRWLRRALRHYRRPYETDVDAIEDTELSAMEAREPMPRNVADFQNHPIYALARHLRRHQVLLPDATAVGTVSAGSKAPSERIYRRRDVRLAYTADRWYRQGRIVLPNEIPAKWLPKRARKRGADEDEDNEEDDGRNHAYHPTPAGVPAFTLEQTELYRAPPVVDGRVPKNKFGNVELYVPSMVPPGGEHVADEGAARAAFLLGVDYAPALTGFRFDGSHHGTAVLRGAVVAAEHADAVRAVLAGLADQAAQAEVERRARLALRMWAALLRGLRIRARIRAAAEDRGEEVEDDVEDKDDEDEDDEDDKDKEPDDTSDVTEEYDMVMDDNQGGGFLVE